MDAHTIQHWFIFINNAITATISSILCIYILYAVFFKYKDEISKEKIKKRATYLTVLAIIIHTIVNVTTPFDAYYHLVNPTPDKAIITYYLWTISWAFSRILLYSVYVYRCYVVYFGTMYQYKFRYYMPLIIAICIQSLLIALSVIQLGTYETNEENVILATLIQAVFCFFDLVITVYLMYLFINPIRRLLVAHIEVEETKKLLNVSLRIMLLSIVSLITSLIFQLSWTISLGTHHKYRFFFVFAWVWSIDTMINIICLYLSISTISKKQYPLICICHKTVFLAMVSMMETRTNVINIKQKGSVSSTGKVSIDGATPSPTDIEIVYNSSPSPTSD